MPYGTLIYWKGCWQQESKEQEYKPDSYYESTKFNANTKAVVLSLM